MKGSCSTLSKLLEKYFDEETTSEEKSLVEAHLPDCQACQDVLRSMEELRTLIKAPVEEAVEGEDFPWVWQKIERAIQSEEKPSRWQVLRSWIDFRVLLRKRVLIPVVGTIALLLFITTQLLIKKTPSLSHPSVVEYVASDTYNVMVFESEKADVTVIWLFESPEQSSSTS
ncbi:MAG: zf-HC2 domain-containing protein [Thermodesulfobacteriota bacterium]